MKITRQYNYPLKPDKHQKEIMMKIFGSVRFLYNHYLDSLKEKKSQYRLAKEIVLEYKIKYPFLEEIDNSILMHVIFQAQDNIKNLHRYKKRRDSFCSFTLSNLYKRPIYIVDEKWVTIAPLGKVKIVYHRRLPSSAKIKKATVFRQAEGKYFISICVESEKNPPFKHLNPQNSIGLDYSSAHFYVDSNGNTADLPHFYRNKEKRIAALDRKIRNSTPGSNNYFKYRQERAKIFARITNQRNDHLHKLSTKLSKEYDIICVEDLDLKEIAEKENLGKSTLDNSYAKFVEMLKYKMEEQGKLLLHVNRYYPSSKTCSGCGFVIKELPLDERTWTCPNCHMTMNRDHNAAINIRNKCISNHFGRRVFGL